jgi:hypothetical protein
MSSVYNIAWDLWDFFPLTDYTTMWYKPGHALMRVADPHGSPLAGNGWQGFQSMERRISWRNDAYGLL